jgi:mannose-6-phosphate isomerase-like protein (cupin superfamily)
MRGTVIGRPARIPPLSGYGNIANNTDGLGDLRGLVGGTGTCRWKQVINGMHLPGAWNCVEYVQIPPGASCGRHLHADTEEIYYILGGTAEMYLNGDELEVAAGELITCPIGTVHGIGVPAGAAETMSFLVVEVFPGAGPPLAPIRFSVRDQLQSSMGYRGFEGDGLDVALVDLTRHFSGPWRKFTELAIPADEAVGPYTLPGGTAEVLFIASGEAEMTAGSEVLKGGPGLCLGAALGSTVTVRNRSSSSSLRVLSTEVAA